MSADTTSFLGHGDTEPWFSSRGETFDTDNGHFSMAPGRRVKKASTDRDKSTELGLLGIRMERRASRANTKMDTSKADGRTGTRPAPSSR